MTNNNNVPGVVARVVKVEGTHSGLRWEPNVNEKVRVGNIQKDNLKLPARVGDYLRVLYCPPNTGQQNPHREKTGNGEYRLWWYVQALNQNRQPLTGPNSTGWLAEREVKRNENGDLEKHEYIEVFSHAVDCPSGFADALEPGGTALVTPGLTSSGKPDHLMLRAGPSRSCAKIHDGAGLEKGDEVRLSARCAITKGANQHMEWEYIWRLLQVNSGKNAGKRGWVCQVYKHRRKGVSRFSSEYYLTAA